MSRAADQVGDAIERAIVDVAVKVLDRRAAALRSTAGVDAATLADRSRMAAALEDAARDVQALMGPLVPAQGRLALTHGLLEEAS